MLQQKQPTNSQQTRFSRNCKIHKQPFTLICLHTGCHSCYKLLCIKCKKQKHYQHPNRVLSLGDFYQMLQKNKMQFIENSLGMSLVGIRNKLLYVSNFRIFILEKQAMLIENARLIHGVVMKIHQEKKLLKEWVESVIGGRVKRQGQELRQEKGQGQNQEQRQQQQSSQQLEDPQLINQSLQQIKKYITYNPIQSTIRITTQTVITQKIELQKLSQSTKTLIDDIRQYLMKIIEILISSEEDDEDIEYVEHEDVDEKVFNINVKRPNSMEINEREVRYKMEELEGLFGSLLKGEIERHQEHVESDVAKLEEEIKFKQEIVQNIRKRSSSKATTTIIQQYPQEDYFGEQLVEGTRKNAAEEILQSKGINTLYQVDNKFTYISLKNNDNTKTLHKSTNTNEQTSSNPSCIIEHRNNLINNNNNGVKSNPFSNIDNKRSPKNAQSVKSPENKLPNNARFNRNNKYMQNNNIISRQQQQNQLRSLRYNNKKKCSLFYGEGADGFQRLLSLEQTSFNTTKEEQERYNRKCDRQDDSSKLESESMLLEEDEPRKIKGRLDDEKEKEKDARVNELEKEVERLSKQVQRLREQNLLRMEQMNKHRQQYELERSQLLQKIRQYQQQERQPNNTVQQQRNNQLLTGTNNKTHHTLSSDFEIQQDELMKHITRELKWSLGKKQENNGQLESDKFITIQNQSQTINKLIEEKLQLDGKLNELQKQIKQFEKRDIELKSELIHIKKNNQDKLQLVQQQNNHLKEYNKQLLQQLSNSIQQRKNLQQRSKSDEQLIQQIQKTIQQMKVMTQENRLQLKQKEAKMKQQRYQAQKAKVEIQKLRKQLSEKIMMIGKNEEQLEQKNQQINLLYEQVNNHLQQQQLFKLQKEKNLQTEAVNKNQQLQTLHDQIKQKDTQLQQLSLHISTLSQEILTLQQDIITLKYKHQQLITQHQCDEQEIQQLKLQYHQINEQLSQLRQQSQQQVQLIKKQKQQLAELFRRELQFRQKQLQQQFNKSKASSNERESMLIEEKIQLQNKLQQLNQQLGEKQKEIDLRKQSYRVIEEECREIKQESEELQGKLDQLQGTIEGKDKRIVQLNNQINSINQQLMQIKDQHQSLQNKLQQIKQSSQQQIANSNSEIVKLKKAIMKAFEENNQLSQKSQYFQFKINQYEQKNKQLASENQMLEDKLTTLISNKTLLKSGNNNTTKNINKNNASTQTTSPPNNQQLIHSKHTELRHLIEIITTDMQILQEKVKQNTVIEKVYLKELDRKRTENRKLKQEIEEYKFGDKDKDKNIIGESKTSIIIEKPRTDLVLSIRSQTDKSFIQRLSIKDTPTKAKANEPRLIINPPPSLK